jgi:hypothetical protein
MPRKRKPTPIWTRERIVALLDSNDQAVLRALVVLYDRQTQDEREMSETVHHNERGFSAFHARQGSCLARLVLSGRSLWPEQLERARHLVRKYAQQLADEANAKDELRQAKLRAERADHEAIDELVRGGVPPREAACAVRALKSPSGACPCSECLEREMQAMERIGDIVQTARDEHRKQAFRASAERLSQLTKRTEHEQETAFPERLRADLADAINLAKDMCGGVYGTEFQAVKAARGLDELHAELVAALDERDALKGTKRA